MARPAKTFPPPGLVQDEHGRRASPQALPHRRRRREGQGSPRKLENERDNNGGSLPPELTVAEAAALFLREVETDKGLNHQTFIWYRRNLQRLIARLGNRKLKSLTKLDGTEYKRWLKEEARTRPTGRRPAEGR